MFVSQLSLDGGMSAIHAWCRKPHGRVAYVVVLFMLQLCAYTNAMRSIAG